MMEKRLQMTAENLRAIREGRKTQTRRVIKNQSGCQDYFDIIGNDPYPYYYRRRDAVWDSFKTMDDLIKKRCPYQVGDLAWIPETWAEIGWWEGDVPVHTIEGNHIIYKAECPDFRYLDSEGGQRYTKDGWEASIWKSPLSMPKKYAREWVRITGVRVERLQDISEEDVDKEGFNGDFPANAYPHLFKYNVDYGYLSMPECFGILWDSINKEYPWSSNPWVWVYDLERGER